MQDRNSAAKECPIAPAATATVYARTLHRACLVLGGVDKLARHPGVPVVDLLGWLKGEEKPAEAAFLAAVEVVLLHAEAGTSN